MKTNALLTATILAATAFGCADTSPQEPANVWTPDYSRPFEVRLGNNLGEVHWESVTQAADYINKNVGADVFRMVRSTTPDIVVFIDREGALKSNEMVATQVDETGCRITLSRYARTEAAGLGLLQCLGFTSPLIDSDVDPTVVESLRASIVKSL